jgi:uroporphyrin-III C-methyltransferase/precorrin-2 dehydrogenase/sirohydrochlorin ferrochelatase
VLPERIGELAGLIDRFRERAAAVRRVSGPMRRFWERVVDGPIGAAALAGRMAEAEAALERAFQDAANTSEREIGSVHIVATGAGDPDLLTLRALQALQNADVVLHDDAPDAILDRARRDADRYRVPLRHSGTTAADAIIAYARRGLSVVLLVPEDAAATFGDAEFAALENAGLRAILVPGVSGPAATPRPTTESSV